MRTVFQSEPSFEPRMDTKEHEWKDGGAPRHEYRTLQGLINPASIQRANFLIMITHTRNAYR